MRKHRSIKFKNQLFSNDCGIACIQMICHYYGRKYNVSTVLNHCDVSKLGISLKDINNFFSIAGFETVSAGIRLDELKDVPLPTILYYKKGHYVILEKIKEAHGRTYYYVVDPSFGRVKLSKEDLSIKWISGDIGIAVLINPIVANDGIVQKVIEKKSNSINVRLKSILQKNRVKLLIILALTLLILVTNWCVPLLLKENIDKGILDKNIPLVWAILLSQFIFVASNIFANSISDILTTKISLEINIDFNRMYFLKILNLPISFFEKKFKSDLIEGLRDQDRINNFLSNNLIDLIVISLNLVVFSTILIIYNYKVFLLFVLFSTLSIVVTFLFLKKKRNIDYSLFTTESENRNNIYELIMGIVEIKVNSAEDNRVNKWKESENALKKLKIKDSFINFYILNSNSFISKLRDIILIGLCSILVIKEDMTLGSMVLMSYVLGQLAAPIDDIISFSQTLQKLNISFDRLSKVYEKVEELQDVKNENLLMGKIDEIVLKDVNFRYNSGGNNILSNINLIIPANKTTAVVGESGSGKSTLMKLLLGFYLPTSGVLTLGGRDMNTINIREWRRKCGVVMQDGYIFSGTVIDNITISDATESIDVTRLRRAICLSEMEEVIERLPLKGNTLIGESGIALSGGEKQRLYIARALYKDPDFIFFDEATSNLDTINERKIMLNLKSYAKSKTTIIIAHRLSTIKNADNIIVLKHGRIVGQGTHLELLRRNAVYYDLCQTQLDI